MNVGRKFAATMNAAGVKVHSAIQLGKWMHVDTNQSEESKIYHALFVMGAKEIKTLKPGADGKHLSGAKHHRIVATF